MQYMEDFDVFILNKETFVGKDTENEDCTFEVSLVWGQGNIMIGMHNKSKNSMVLKEDIMTNVEEFNKTLKLALKNYINSEDHTVTIKKSETSAVGDSDDPDNNDNGGIVLY